MGQKQSSNIKDASQAGRVGETKSRSSESTSGSTSGSRDSGATRGSRKESGASSFSTARPSVLSTITSESNRGSTSGPRDSGATRGSRKESGASSFSTARPSVLSTITSESTSSSSSRNMPMRHSLQCGPPIPNDPAASESEMYAPKLPNRFTRFPKELWEDSALPLQNDNSDKVVPVGFSATERRLLLTLWHEIATNSKHLGIKYYVSLITLYPDFRGRFGGDRVSADAHIQLHAKATIRYLINLSNFIDDDEAFNESVNQLAAFHEASSITKDDLLVICTVFLNMVIKELPDLMFPASAYALIIFLSTITKRMFHHLQEIKSGKKYREDMARPSLLLKRKFSSTSEELYETITEWHIEVIHLHNERLVMSQHPIPSAANSRALEGLLAACMPSPTTSPGVTDKQGKGKK